MVTAARLVFCPYWDIQWAAYYCLRDFERWSGVFWVRLGIYGGVLLTIQMRVAWIFVGGLEHLISWLPICLVFHLVITALPTVLLWRVAAPRHGWAYREYRKQIDAVLAMLIWFAAAMTLLAFLGVLTEVACTALTPFLATAAYAAMSLRISPGRASLSRFSLQHLLGSIGWLSAFLASWRFAVHLAIEQYATLPTSQPPPPFECYVCTAAARGHRRLVGSEEIAGRDGQIALVNLQLRRFKCCELALRAASPRAHRWLRVVYDRVGPRLAACCVHPLLADMAYFSLKPLEWLAVGCVRRLLPNFDALAARLYRGPK